MGSARGRATSPRSSPARPARPAAPRRTSSVGRVGQVKVLEHDQGGAAQGTPHAAQRAADPSRSRPTPGRRVPMAPSRSSSDSSMRPGIRPARRAPRRRGSAVRSRWWWCRAVLAAPDRQLERGLQESPTNQNGAWRAAGLAAPPPGQAGARGAPPGHELGHQALLPAPAPPPARPRLAGRRSGRARARLQRPLGRAPDEAAAPLVQPRLLGEVARPDHSSTRRRRLRRRGRPAREGELAEATRPVPVRSVGPARLRGQEARLLEGVAAHPHRAALLLRDAGAGRDAHRRAAVAARLRRLAHQLDRVDRNCMAPAMSSSPATSRPNTATRPSTVWLCRSAPCL